VDRRYLLCAALLVSGSISGAVMAHGSAVADGPQATPIEPDQVWAAGGGAAAEPSQIADAAAVTMELAATEPAKVPTRPRGEAFDGAFFRAPVGCPETGARSRLRS
jgi:hypothetical protein